MKLIGKVYDFGDAAPSEHLRAISSELAEQAYINGEDDPHSAKSSRCTICQR